MVKLTRGCHSTRVIIRAVRYFLLFSLSEIAFCFMVATFFTRSMVRGVLLLLLLLLLLLPPPPPPPLLLVRFWCCCS